MAATTGARVAVLSRLKVLSPLKKRNFALLMAGRATSSMGRSMRVFARAWLVLELTGSPFLLGLVTASLSFSMLFLPFLAGILADRMDRRRLLIITEFALVVLWAAVSLIITLGYIRWWHLMISAVLSGIIQSFGRTGHLAMLGNVVGKDELPNAVAINSAAQSWPGAVGLLLATVLIGIIGTAGVFWITALGQLITGITLLLLHWKEEEIAAAKESVGSNFAEGLKHVRGEPVILGMLLMAAVFSLFAGSYRILLPFFARDILGVGAQGLGTLMLFSTVGTSIGAAVVVGLSNMPRRGLLLMFAALGYTLFIVSFSRSEIFYLSLGIVFGMGLFSTFSQTMMSMIMQLLAPDHLRGRVMSLRVSVMGLNWIGLLGMGAMAEFLGSANTVLIGGSLYGLVVTAMYARMSHLRNFR